MPLETLPDLGALVDPLIGCPYSEYDCWKLVRHLFKAGWEIDLEADPMAAISRVQEIWFAGDAVDPLALTQQWDLWIFRTHGLASSHVGIVIDPCTFVHTRPRVGVCLERLARWQPRLLQMARLRRLC